MKILSSEQIRAADQATIKNEPVSSLQLMERAATTFTEWFRTQYTAGKPLAVVCGKGNNGGDGLVFARLISAWGFHCVVYIIQWSPKGSPDFEANLFRLKTETQVQIKDITEDSIPDFSAYEILVDAIFGTGLNRPVEGLAAKVIEAMNESPAKICAIDLPSGLQAEKPAEGDVIHAEKTFSFELPKLAFFISENAAYIGEWAFGSIRLNPGFIQKAKTRFYYTVFDDVESILNNRSRFSHKGTYGHVLAWVSGYGKAGAGILTTQAALKSGCGLVTAYIPSCNYGAFQSAIPEVMVMTGKGEKFLIDLPELSVQDFLVAAGPGVGTHKKTGSALKALLKKVKRPVVLDADALNLIAQDSSIWKEIPEKSILTPHPGEFKRLAGMFDHGYQQIEALSEMAVRQKVIIVLKGAFTSVALPDGNVHFNSTGNPGMATAGSGDVPTGILAGLLAQGYEPEDAALFGVFLHGLAGDTAAGQIAQESITAQDITNHISDAYQYFRKRI